MTIIGKLLLVLAMLAILLTIGLFAFIIFELIKTRGR